MTTKQATGIALKFFSMWLLFTLLAALPTIFSYGFSQLCFDTPAQSSLQFLAPSVGIAFCVVAIALLWKSADSLLKSARSDEEPISNNMSPETLMKIALSCMGVYIAIQGILAFLEVYAQARIEAQTTHEKFHLNANYLITPIVQFAFGCVLIAKPKQWVKIIRSIGER